MTEPLAYHIMWTTYGTWLPGDDRGWASRDGVFHPPAPEVEATAGHAMAGPPVFLTPDQRAVAADTVRDHCRHRGWTPHAANPRSNHVHVVVSAAGPPEQIFDQLKAWCSRRLNAATADPPAKWWAYHAGTKRIWDEKYLHEAVEYVLERQDG